MSIICEVPRHVLAPTSLAIAEAIRLHAAGIRMSVPDEEEMFRLGIGWIPAKDPESCGTFVARCFRAAGLRADVAKYAFASTYRLHRWSRGLSIGKWTPPKTAQPRRIDVKDALAGDIVVIRTGRNKPYGDHITLMTGRAAGGIETLEYNAKGTLGDGTVGRGVVANVRPLGKVVVVYRVQGEDFAA